MTKGIIILRREANLHRSNTLKDSSFDSLLYSSLRLYIYSYWRSGLSTPFLTAILFKAPIISSVFSVANRSIGVF